MNQKDLNFLAERLEELEEKIQNICLMYRPPDRGEHVELTSYLDEVEKRLRELEK